MLTSFELIVHVIALLLLPIPIYSIWTREPPTSGGLFGRYYRNHPALFRVANFFLLTFCLSCAWRLALHFGLLGPVSREVTVIFIYGSVVVLGIVFLVLFGRAWLRFRRQSIAKS